MSSPPNRCQLQKQISVDHADGEDDLCLVTSQNDDDEEVVHSTTDDHKVEGHDPSSICYPDDETHSQLVQEFRALEIKVNAMYGKNQQFQVLDDNREDMLTFVVRTLSSSSPDKLGADRQHLLECNKFLESDLFANPSVIALSSPGRKVDKNDSNDEADDNNAAKKFSVEWTNEDPRARMVMHKLCAFYGLQHNIVGQHYSTTIKIDFDPVSFIEWRCSIIEISRYIELKKMLGMTQDSDEVSSTTAGGFAESKTILKRNLPYRQQSYRCNSSNDYKTYEDRHSRYFQVRERLGLQANEVAAQTAPSKRIQRPVRQFQSMPTHDSSTREQLTKVRMEAQLRSITTDCDVHSVFADESYICSHFSSQSDMSFDSVGPRGSATDLCTEGLSQLTFFSLSENTKFYKLMPVDLAQITPDENIYVFTKENSNPFLLLTREGKPYHKQAPALLPVTDLSLHKGSISSPAQSSSSSAAHSISGTNNNATLTNKCKGNSFSSDVNRNLNKSGQYRSINSPIHPSSTHLQPRQSHSGSSTSISNNSPLPITQQGTFVSSMLSPAQQIQWPDGGAVVMTSLPYPQQTATPPHVSHQQHPQMSAISYLGPYSGSQPQHIPGQIIDTSGQATHPGQMCAPGSVLHNQVTSAPQGAFYSPGMVPYPGFIVATSPLMMPQQMVQNCPVNPQRLMHPQHFTLPNQIPPPGLQIQQPPGSIPHPQQTYLVQQGSTAHHPSNVHYAGLGASPMMSVPSPSLQYTPTGAGNASNIQSCTPYSNRQARPHIRQSGSFNDVNNCRNDESH